MSDKQPAKKGRGRPPKPKNVNMSRINTEPIESTESTESTNPNTIKLSSKHIDNINNYKIDNPEDIQSIVQNINDSELAMAIDESFASNIAMKMNASSIISNNFEVEAEDDTEMSIILEQIREREEQEKRDEEFARSLAEENNNLENNEDNEDNDNIGASGFGGASGFVGSNDDDDLSSVLEQIRQMEMNSNNKNKVKSSNKFTEDRNIRNMQDIEYERSLLLDKKKDENKRNFEIHENNNISESEDESEDESEEESEDESEEEQSDQESEDKTPINNINIVKTENKNLTVKEMRDARLAFFNKK